MGSQPRRYLDRPMAARASYTLLRRGRIGNLACARQPAGGCGRGSRGAMRVLSKVPRCACPPSNRSGLDTEPRSCPQEVRRSSWVIKGSEGLFQARRGGSQSRWSRRRSPPAASMPPTVWVALRSGDSRSRRGGGRSRQGQFIGGGGVDREIVGAPYCPSNGRWPAPTAEERPIGGLVEIGPLLRVHADAAPAQGYAVHGVGAAICP